MEDDDSTYIADTDAAKANTSCQGYPNLIDCVLDTFEEVVEEQRWFRFLRSKYDSFNHLEHDDTATLGTRLSIEEVKLRANGTFFSYETAASNIQSNGEEGEDGSDNETMISDGEETMDTVVIIRDCDDVVDQGQREGVEISDDDSYHEDDQYDDEEDDCEDEDDEDDDESDDEEDDDDEEEDEEGEEEEEEQEANEDDHEIVHGIACELEAHGLGEESSSQVELDQDGSVICDMSDTNASIPSVPTSPEPSRKASDSSVCSMLSFPSVDAQSSHNHNSVVVEQDNEETIPSTSSPGPQNRLVSNSFPTVSFCSRQTSKDTKASLGTSNTRNTAEMSLASHKTEHDAHEINDSVEVIGVKRTKPLAFLRFWRKRLLQAKRTKSRSSLKENESEDRMGLLPPQHENQASIQLPFKEKELPKTRVIVTRTSE
jgi:hypothetical protein